MRKISVIIIALLLPSMTLAASGEGDFSISYLFLDEEGNQSVQHSSFNIYEGPGISVEDFSYMLDNGLSFNADMKNIILNNRNLRLGMGKSGLFGLSLSHNQYRRVYNFDGSSFTRRHTNQGLLWLYPHRHLKLWGGGTYIGRSGSMTDLFDPDPGAISTDVDYDQVEYKGGFQLNYEGGLIRGEFRGVEFDDNENEDRDQTRSVVRFDGLIPVPNYEWIVLSGGFRHFETKYDVSDFKISSNRGWGGFRLNLPENFQLRYNFIFDRTSSDSDFVATDNITNTAYLSHVWPQFAMLTAGYRHGINDDFEDEVQSNSFYASGWIRPLDELEIRGEFGLTEEDVKDGSRLIGDESRNRHKFRLKYNSGEYGTIALKYENKVRENEQLGTEIDFISFGGDYSIGVAEYGTLSAGYVLSTGDYDNREDEFEFTDHTVYGDIRTREYRNATAGFGLTYYRSKRDLDVESFILRFNATYEFYDGYAFKAEYNVQNFDDFLVRDQYYTANIVEISLIKHISF
ncbi:MAG: hypothetical protein GWO41_08140 [candidate division Zixibacteria bacterium]|nr:hypothetical protein [candidate division Zixibacteria bacterium]NIR67583.1 hypothetical protein [candidate division Zixibacteria bacterium]NIS16314.1 hypothetical protein [candidate division Zixibacteria bacterium]NIS48844.1 hypothetical protein [candidate division Zixibacteria bacterium]NIT52692.1 hypothetical protein [candidate division Zixibacteria bacterium]